MYIEFYLPSTDRASVIKQTILDEVDRWATRHGILYRTKVVRHMLRLTFDNDSYYTLFVTSWAPPVVPRMPWWQIVYNIVEPMSTVQQQLPK